MKCSICGCSPIDVCLVYDAKLAGRGTSLLAEFRPCVPRVPLELHVCDACEPGAGVTRIRGPLFLRQTRRLVVKAGCN